jgi:acylpyruvate hydrolase
VRLATIRTTGGTRAARIEGQTAIEVDSIDVGALLAAVESVESIAALTTGVEHHVDALDYAPLIPRPGKIFCLGLNYRAHILEMGRELPEYPTVFTKYANALIGARDDIWLPAESPAVDWEAELAVVIGRPVRRATRDAAEAAIAGYTVLNDVSMRDWQ